MKPILSQSDRSLFLSHKGIWPKIDPSAYISPTSVVIGQVSVGAKSSLWFGVIVRGDGNKITIGRGSNIQDGTIIHVNHDRSGDGGMPTYIADHVTIGHMALIHACTLEEGCFIGMKACVMDGAVIGRHAMIAAGSLVTPGKLVGSGELWMGIPARFVRNLSDIEIADNLYISDYYCDVATTYISEALSS